MKYKTPFALAVILATLLFSCSQNSENRKESTVTKELSERTPAQDNFSLQNNITDAASSGSTETSANNWGTTTGTVNGFVSGNYSVNDIISSSAAVGNKNDTVRKFVRTADLRFRVKDVAQATYAIEDIAAKFDGFVTYTNLYSTMNNETVIPVSADSSLETIYYVVQNSMEIRVPYEKLDSTLKAVVPVIDYLEHRVIKADDVQFQLLENRLKQARSAKYEERMSRAIDEKGKKLQETSSVEDKILSKQEQADAALLENLKLADRIEYSTINLFIYQREMFRRELIPNDKNIKAYGPGFFTKVSNALLVGWEILEGIILFLTKSWGVLLFITVLVVIARFAFFRRRSTDY